ncbi:Retrovirus-related Pol polyprotein from transposon TNT 1-94 [Linum grandiflorum]
MWKHICDTHSQNNSARQFELENEIAIFSQGDRDINSYYQAFLTLWTDYDMLTASLVKEVPTAAVLKERDRSRLMQFLMKLQPEFESIRASLLHRNIASLDAAIGELVREEIRLRSQARLDNQQILSAGSDSAFAVGRASNSRPQFHRGHFCNEVGHIQPHCKKRNLCSYCKQSGHIVLECKILAKRNSRASGTTTSRANLPTQGSSYAVEPVVSTVAGSMPSSSGLTSADVRRLIAEALQEVLPSALNSAFATGTTSGNTPRWLLDSAAFNHMTNSRSHFSTLNPNHCTSLQVANGTRILACGMGIVATGDVSLSNTLFVPQLVPNLVSVGQLTEDGCEVTFNDEGCVVQDQTTGVVLGTGKKDGRVFVLEDYNRLKEAPQQNVLEENFLNFQMNKDVSAQTSLDNCVDHTGLFSYSVQSLDSLDFNGKSSVWDLWHCRLGHLHNARLLTMFRRNMLPDSISSKFCPPTSCISCIEAKMSQSSFSSSDTVYEAPFDLIHTDLWGPSPVTSRMGYKYFALFIDHATRFTWIYFLRRKSELIDHAKAFVEMIRTQFGKTVKIIRSDPGGEFSSHSLLEFYRLHGIISQQSCPGVSQQNGLVERKHRHVLELTRALLLNSQVPGSFWVEAVATVIFLINRQITSVLADQSPFYRLYSKLPDYSRLRVFGCVCFVLLPKKERHKLDPKTARCVFVGYSDRFKGYLCYDPGERRMRISCHVMFLEQIMYYTASRDDHTPSLDFLISLPHFDEVVASPIDDAPQDDHLTLDLSLPSASSGSSAAFVPPDTNSDSLVSSSSYTGESSTGSSTSRSPSHGTIELEVTTTSPPLVPAPRRSNRSNLGQTPARLQDYVGYSTEPIPVPSHYRFAVGHPEWDKAVQDEFQALEANQTWEVIPRFPGVSTIGSRWVFTIKLKPDGSLDRYKARLVALGYRQEFGIDYEETFAPVVKMQTVRSILAVAAMKKWPIVQFDVKNAFLHGDLKETIYMECPDGYTKGGKDMICKLRRSLYGLKQAPRAWFEKFHGTILQAGFVQSHTDPSMFIRQSIQGITVLLLYVDDMIVTGGDSEGIKELTESLRIAFNLKELGDASYFLGLEISRSEAGLFVNQRKYIADLLEAAQYSDFRPCTTPMEQNLKMSRDNGELLEDQTFYRSIVGSLIYLTHTRPDIAYAFQNVSQFMGTARTSHLDAVHRLLRYLRHTKDVGMFFPSSGSPVLEAFADADYAGCIDTRRSTSGWCIRFGRSFVSWRCRKQDKVSKSSTEAEYRSMSEVSSEIVWLQRLFQELGIVCESPMRVYGDNTSAIQIAVNPVLHDRTKHIEVHVHYIRQLVEEGVIQLSYLSTEDQTADTLTKALSSSRHWYLSSKLMLRTQHQFEGGC